MLEVRKVRCEELDQCAWVIRESFRDVADAFDLTRENCPTHTSFIEPERLRWECAHGTILFGAFADGMLAGCASTREVGDGVWEISHLAVLPVYRCHGIGGRLIDCCVDEARRQDATIVKIGIIEENKKLKTWYLSHGFRSSGTARFPYLPFTIGFMELDVC